MVKSHFVSITNLPAPLSSEDEHEALIKFKVHSDSTAKNLLIEHNLRLVHYIASKYANTEEEFKELFSIGTLGLVKGINTFDINKKIKLDTYAGRCIENEIRMSFRRANKLARNVSIDEPITTDSEGNPLTIDTILSDPKDEEAIYRCEETEYVSVILSIALNSLSTKKLLLVLYTLAEIKQKDIGKRLSIGQSVVSRQQRAFFKDVKELREFSDELLKLRYAISQSNKRNFIFFLDKQKRFCLSCHSKFSKSFLEFMKPYNIGFETAKDTGRMIIRLPINESSYLFCAKLIKYLTEHIIFI